MSLGGGRGPEYSSPEKVHQLSVLRDLYESLLAPRQREVIDMKIDEDLSLAEMAERLGVSRQACEDAVQRAEKALITLERKLGLRSRRVTEDRLLTEALAALATMDEGNWKQVRSLVVERLENIRSGGET